MAQFSLDSHAARTGRRKNLRIQGEIIPQPPAVLSVLGVTLALNPSLLKSGW
jgi:hypothetical protein